MHPRTLDPMSRRDRKPTYCSLCDRESISVHARCSNCGQHKPGEERPFPVVYRKSMPVAPFTDDLVLAWTVLSAVAGIVCVFVLKSLLTACGVGVLWGVVAIGWSLLTWDDDWP